jgi:predicted amidohydrolase
LAKYVNISCLSAHYCNIEPTIDYEQATETMIGYWKDQLEQVLPDRPDIIVLPEACDRPNGYNYDQLSEFYRHRKDRIRDFFAEVAQRNQCYIAYSAIREEVDGSFRNSTQLIGRKGEVIGIYNKNHVVIGERTEQNILYGRQAPVFQTDFGKVACLICFDLNFHELREQYVKLKPDLLLFSSAYHGGLMQNFWSYSCRAYMASSIYTHSPSTILSPVGEEIASTTNYYHFITRTVNLDYAVLHIDLNGSKFNQIKQKYGPKVRIHDPGYLGAVLMTSETEQFTVQDVIREFELELLEDYLARSLTHRNEPGNLEL